ncbi:unnamed protein product [Sphagnum jensenii]|uniref:Uncharacterized protein n=1 Tax=Sphagnum jensenii TaxID=128206 RepID=A0ABP0VFE8_9BRYO
MVEREDYFRPPNRAMKEEVTLGARLPVALLKADAPLSRPRGEPRSSKFVREYKCTDHHQEEDAAEKDGRIRSQVKAVAHEGEEDEDDGKHGRVVTVEAAREGDRGVGEAEKDHKDPDDDAERVADHEGELEAAGLRWTLSGSLLLLSSDISASSRLFARRTGCQGSDFSSGLQCGPSPRD